MFDSVMHLQHNSQGLVLINNVRHRGADWAGVRIRAGSRVRRGERVRAGAKQRARTDGKNKRERARRQLTNSQRQVDVVAEERLQLELLTQSQMEGSAIHG